MIQKTIEAEYTEKVQIEQFEPVQVGITLTATLEEEDDAGDCYEELMMEAKAAAGRELQRRIQEHEMENEVER